MMSRITLVTVALLMGSVALAQSITDPSTWPQFWLDTGALSGLVLVVMAILKTRLPQIVSGPLGLFTSIIVGITLGLVGMALGYYEGNVAGAASLGFMAAIVASGGYDLVIKNIIGWLKGEHLSPQP
jgi:hypothetical protein